MSTKMIASNLHMLFASLKHGWKRPKFPAFSLSPRTDRLTVNSKGGIMIAANTAIQVHHVTNFSFSHIMIQATTVTLILPNHKQIEVTLVYRSPSVPTSTLLTVLPSILSQLTTSSIPSIILDDFNEDLLAKSDLRQPSFMSSHGFSQLVQSPTTDNGTLIDHVY